MLATRRLDGRTQLSPVNAGLVDGAVVISSRATLAKVANLRRQPEASLLVLNDGFYGSVGADRRPRPRSSTSPPTAPSICSSEVYRAIAGEHPDWDDYRAAMVRDERVVIRIHPMRASGEL